MATPTANWRAVVDAAAASRRADCSHQLARRDDALVWLRPEKAGGVIEVTSMCHACHRESDYSITTDYAERLPLPRPSRVRVEYL